MSTVTANDLKIKGIGCLESGSIITQRGKGKFFVVNVEEYEAFEEYRLEKAYQEIKADIENEKIISKKKHIDEIKNV